MFKRVTVECRYTLACIAAEIICGYLNFYHPNQIIGDIYTEAEIRLAASLGIFVAQA